MAVSATATVFNLRAQLDLGRGQQDEVVGDPFQVGEQVRGQHDGQAAVGDAQPAARMTSASAARAWV